MALERHHNGWIILLTFIAGLLLTIIPIPIWAMSWRPEWIIMILTYWCLALPQRVGVVTGWSLGILQDVLSDTLLGQHALTLSLIAYVSVISHTRVRTFPLWQQSVGMGLLVVGNQILHVWIHGMLGHPPTSWTFLYPALTSVVLWPWIFIILRDLRRTYHVC
jgi:rod shape-determining protein MreD